mmetsp:Transcript_52927/g.126938  ORF Transcript_52927/g.126938 Transcript_52927/m.126938 type:complete len:233 (-) Transcript_52927:98-796(-)
MARNSSPAELPRFTMAPPGRGMNHCPGPRGLSTWPAPLEASREASRGPPTPTPPMPATPHRLLGVDTDTGRGGEAGRDTGRASSTGLIGSKRVTPAAAVGVSGSGLSRAGSEPSLPPVLEEPADRLRLGGTEGASSTLGPSPWLKRSHPRRRCWRQRLWAFESRLRAFTAACARGAGRPPPPRRYRGGVVNTGPVASASALSSALADADKATVLARNPAALGGGLHDRRLPL